MKQTKKNIIQSISLLAILLVSFSFASPKKEIAGRQPIINPGKTGTLNKEAIMNKAASIAVPFVKNVGQFSGEVKYAADLFAGRFFLTGKELVYSLFKRTDKKRVQTDKYGRDAEPQEKILGKGLVFREYFVDKKNAKIDFKSMGEQQAETVVSYFKGNDASKWRSGVSSYQAVSLGEVFPGIEVKLKASGKSVEKIFYVFPKSNVAQIKIGIVGIDGLKIDKDGKLIFKNSFGELAMRKPIAWQEIAGRCHEVEVSYHLLGKKFYGFTILGDYDRNYPMVVDPALDNLIASTFLGGISYNYATSLALDIFGNVYLAGYTDSLDFPTTIGAYDRVINPEVFGDPPDWYHRYPTDVFVSKFNGNLTELLASTYLGGAEGSWWNAPDDVAYSLALDSAGNVYVGGVTESPDFPTTPGAYDRSYSDKMDAFISKLDSNLTTLLASTYLGGSGEDRDSSLALDSSGNVYLTGTTQSTDFPTTVGAYGQTYNGGGDAFISKLDSNLSTLFASTFLGGSIGDVGSSLALDGSGNVYLTGTTQSTDFPTTSGAYDRTYNGGTFDAFVSKLDGNLTTLLASTYLGGSGGDSANSLALDGSGNVYLTGTTQSTNFPTTVGAYDQTDNGKDAFVSKLDNHLTTLLTSTYLGGNLSEFGYSLALDNEGNVYVTGYTESVDFPTTPGAYDRTYNGGFNSESPPYYGDAFFSKLDTHLTTLLVSSYLGGSDSDFGRSLAIASTGDIYLIGNTMSTDFPTTPGAYDRTFNATLNYHFWWDYNDAFVSKLNSDLTGITVTSPNGGESWLSGSVHDIVWTSAGAIANARIEVSNDNGSSWSDVIASTANTGSYPWTIPNTPSSRCLVRISDAAYAAVSDTSDAEFSILMNIDLQAERREVKAVSILRQYGRIQFLVDASSVQAAKHRFTRREDRDYFISHKMALPSEMQNNRPLAQDSSAQVAEYRIMRRKGSADFTLLRTIAPTELQNNQFQMQDKYLAKDTPYTYRVEAYNASGQLVGISLEKTI
jgi:hypothetical protein